MDNNLLDVLNIISNTSKKMISELNIKSLYGLDKYSETIKNLEFANKIAKDKTHVDFAMPAAELLKSASNEYSKILESSNIGRSLSEQLKNSLAELHIDTLTKLAVSNSSKMINEISEYYVNMNYEAIIKTINTSLCESRLTASDVSFLKTSKLVAAIGDEIHYPKGLTNSLKHLNIKSAIDIADNIAIKYDLKTNMFLSDEGESNSKELNIICSAKEIFNSVNGEFFSEEELIDFMTYLSKTMGLGAMSKTGQKIYDYIKYLFDDGNKKIDFDKDIYYHCRSRNKDSAPYVFSQMLKAPYGLPWAGRYNHVGNSHYYFSDTRAGAETEVKIHNKKDDVLQTVIIKPIRSAKILDLSNTLTKGKTFLRYLRFPLSDVNDNMPREYLIPCFVSDCCKRIGFEGIKYHGSETYKNYVLWEDGYFEYKGMC